MGTSRKISVLSSRSRRIRGPRDEDGDSQECGAAESSCSDFAAVSALMEMVEQPASKRNKRKAKSPPSTPAGEKAGCMDCGASYSPIWRIGPHGFKVLSIHIIIIITTIMTTVIIMVISEMITIVAVVVVIF